MSEPTKDNPQGEKAKEVTDTFAGIGNAVSGMGDVLRAYHAERGRMVKELGRPLTTDEENQALRTAKGQEPAQREPQHPTPEITDRLHLAQTRDHLQRAASRAGAETPPRRMRDQHGQEIHTESRHSIPLYYEKHENTHDDRDGIYVIDDSDGGQWQLFRTDSFVNDFLIGTLAQDGSFGRKIDVDPEGNIHDPKFKEKLERSAWILVNAAPDLPKDKPRAQLIGKLPDRSYTIDLGKPFGSSKDTAITPKNITLAHPDRIKRSP